MGARSSEFELERRIEALVFGTNERRRRDLEAIYRELTGRSVPFVFSSFELTGEDWRREVARTLEAAAKAGLLRVEPVLRPRVAVRRDAPAEQPLGPSEPERTTEVESRFEVRIVDEIGEPLDGVELAFSSGRTKDTQKTDKSGVARFKAVDASFGSVRVVSTQALGKVLDERWAKPRTGSIPDAPFLLRLLFSEDLPSVQLESEVQHTFVLEPELGKLFLELWDKKSRSRHVDTAYTIAGPGTFSGKTDTEGRVLHERVPAGDYTLTLTQTFPEELKLAPETYEVPLVVLPAAAGAPQIRRVGAIPRNVMARLRGMVFDTNKTFLLPTALPALLQIRDLYERENPSRLLIVGHTDTTAEPSVNDPLSLERAKSVEQYLKDDVDAWLKNYDAGVPEKKRWGPREDRLMMLKLDGFDTRPPEQGVIAWYQERHNALVKSGAKPGRSELKADGKAGPKTRTELIFEYMSLDGASLKDQEDFRIDIQTHGCGENFPLDQTGLELDQRAANERNDENDRSDRRVELFFFDDEYGVVPTPTGPKGEEYLVWRKLSQKTADTSVEGVNSRATLIELHDTLFRTNSAVVLPEGEAPSASAHGSLTSVSMFAQALRHNEDHPGRRLLIAGHTDTTGEAEHNQRLSEARANMALALLTGQREKFVALATAHHTVSDYKQIIKWCTEAFSAFFDFDAGRIDDNAATGTQAVRAFQTQYNAHKGDLGAAAQPNLNPDGVVGPKTWGAFFDVYEHGIRDELGEEPSEVAKLRTKLSFLDESTPARGFGEQHPIQAAGKDRFRSQANRRVELLFFEPGNEPDPAILNEAPELTELYQAGAYERQAVDPALSARRVPYFLKFLDSPILQEQLAPFEFELRNTEHGWSQNATATDAATLESGTRQLLFKLPPMGTYDLRLLNEGTPAMNVFVRVPHDRLSERPTRSTLAESESGPAQETTPTEQLRAAYESVNEPFRAG